MNSFQSDKILKMLGIIAAIFMFVGIASCIHSKNSMTLEEYAAQQSEISDAENNVTEEDSQQRNQ